MNVNSYLIANYPLNIESIKFDAGDLEGDLIIENYANLKEINIGTVWTPSKERGEFRIVTIKDLPLLEEISIILCNVEEIIIENCNNIKTIRLGFNKIKDLKFLNNLNPVNLEYLSIVNNEIFSENISIFSKFINLKTLKIGNENVDPKQAKKGNNKFVGNLNKLQNLSKLREIHISFTNVEGSFLSLSNNVERIYCESNNDCECKNIKKDLEKHARFNDKKGYFLVNGIKNRLEKAEEKLNNNFSKEDIDLLKSTGLFKDNDYVSIQQEQNWNRTDKIAAFTALGQWSGVIVSFIAVFITWALTKYLS